VDRRAVDQKHIEAAEGIGPPGEIQARRREQALALRRGDALGRAAEAGPAAHAHLGEHQHAALFCDEVDFAEAAAPVALQDTQAGGAKDPGAKVFGSRTLGVHGTLNELEVLRLTPGVLYVVATPIGNLADASPRSLETLRDADLVACEDTRTTRTLLARHGISARTVALHAHNERRAAGGLIAALREGRSVALVSDAGTPGVSDPGAWLVAEAHRAGIRVSPVPGPNAAAAALSASGFAAPRFLFAGFLPASPAARRKALEALEAPCPVVIYEAPHRVAETLRDLKERFGDAREIVVARELTKKFEELARLPLGEAPDWLAARAERSQGEFVLVLAPGAEQERRALDADKVLAVLLEALAPSEAARLAARITGAPKNVLYRKTVRRVK
jgi:16S rRNA (cytidine1402-2'-O)-methyltransferase